jgi:pyridoxal phosphate enzyme (YggS family)
MHKSILNLNSIKNEIEKENIDLNKVEIIAISKTFSIDNILPLINHGHFHFGENKIQEALEKWPRVKDDNKKVKLHFVGKLQTNKVKFAIPLFDYIHSLDNSKLAEKISSQQTKTNFKPKIFVQVNIGEETQKNGVSLSQLDEFILHCQKNLDLNIVGLMCLPPNDKNTEIYFEKMNKLNSKYGFKELSMGMSADYLSAIKFGSTFIRVGTKIFGDRTK